MREHAVPGGGSHRLSHARVGSRGGSQEHGIPTRRSVPGSMRCAMRFPSRPNTSKSLPATTGAAPARMTSLRSFDPIADAYTSKPPSRAGRVTKRKRLPSGRNWGQRSAVSSCVESGSWMTETDPPAAETRHSGPVGTGAKTIWPSFPQVPRGHRVRRRRLRAGPRIGRPFSICFERRIRGCGCLETRTVPARRQSLRVVGRTGRSAASTYAAGSRGITSHEGEREAIG